MTIHLDPVIVSRINRAYNKLSPASKGKIFPVLAKAGAQALTVSQTGIAPIHDSTVPHQALFALSALTNDKNDVLSGLVPGRGVTVGKFGEIWGTDKYQQLDPGWAETVAVWLENLNARYAFPTNPATIKVDAATIGKDGPIRIAIAGDWGTGEWRTASNPAPGTDVARHISLFQPDITIHLGDVYYAGTADQEEHLLTTLWPGGLLATLTLNSNHEMYSGAQPYFQQALGNKRFQKQQETSFFVIEHEHWVVVGLDSAYYSDPISLYMNGWLGPDDEPQMAFFKEQVAKGKRVIVLTHHNGLSEDGTSETALWSQVMGAFKNGTGPAYWYWGHVHAGVVYNPHGPAQVRTRCCGHGAVPWGQASGLAKSKSQTSPTVAWYENRSAHDPDIPQRVLNGFTILELEGPNLKETFYDENGGISWKSY